MISSVGSFGAVLAIRPPVASRSVTDDDDAATTSGAANGQEAITANAPSDPAASVTPGDESGTENQTSDDRAPARSRAALTEEQKRQVAELQARDREVRAHEMAHKAAAAGLRASGPSYSYQTGPDGRRYAVGGQVNIDTSPGRTPEETIRKAEQIIRAARAPAQPSAQDQAVAAQAAAMAAQARAERGASGEDDDDDGDPAARGTAETAPATGGAARSAPVEADRGAEAASSVAGEADGGDVLVEASPSRLQEGASVVFKPGGVDGGHAHVEGGDCPYCAKGRAAYAARARPK
ncbi:MAG: putative metalloprotease CJM1_0395 family protein [Myxococcota bacterium]